ncbi:Sirohydrochlorin cobaltochelatase CbiK [Klebsiella pneumoniae subsp. rhinoscleromatis]|nr:Sirohydrochlorin cobaltochelatase CbiK [Klebsiella pneumoniae subsp. rhinoscleromatis]
MKKALLVVSFGTSYHDTREKNIAGLRARSGRQLPGPHAVPRLHLGDDYSQTAAARRLFISILRCRLCKSWPSRDTRDVAIQSLHIINGDEYEKIVREVQSMRPRFQRLTLGAPLLSGHGRLCAADAGPAPADAAAGGDGASGVYGARAPATTPSRPTPVWII